VSLLGAVLLLAALPALWPKIELLRTANRAERSERPRALPLETPLAVTGIVVEPQVLAEVVTSTGTLLAAEGVDLQAEVSGKIASINFVEGARVRAGDLLVKLNDADLLARRTAAEHELALAELRERRASDLLGRGFVIRDDHDSALRTVHVRRAEIAIIEAEIAKTEIRAPFDGVAGLRYVSTGAFVNASTRIATVQRIDMLKIDFAIPERYADKIEVGNPIAFTVAGRGESFTGEVYAYDPRIDPETRTLLLRARCPNPGETLLPGAFANVHLELSAMPDAILVPAEALIPDFEAAYVFVAAGGAVERRRVVTGTRTARDVQILQGLARGDVVVTSGLQQLRDGAQVSVDVHGAATRPPLSPSRPEGYE
jgi:membrane fusion protein (multidrug efflux system)